MTERYRLPEEDWTHDFFAEITLREENDYLVATGYFEAAGRGSEMLGIVENKLQEIARSNGKKVKYRFEPQDFIAKGFIQKQPGYNMRGRSFDRNPIYEKEFHP